LSFKKWLVHKLTGASSEEFKQTLRNQVLDTLYDKLKSKLDDEVEWLKIQLKDERNRNEMLQSIIFTKFGITKDYQQSLSSDEHDQKLLRPIPTKAKPWTSVKAKLEADDKEKYWKDKQAEFENGLKGANNVS
jgi:hypothetical protein